MNSFQRIVTTTLAVMALFVLTACQPTTQSSALKIRVIVDGKEVVYETNERSSVLQFLQSVNIRLGELDRVNPDEFTPLTDKMLITVIRVEDRQECKEETIPYNRTTLKSPDLPPGTTKVGQPGTNGKQTVCYDVLYEDGVEKSRTAGNPTIVTRPIDEIVYVAIDRSKVDPVPVNGFLVYISEKQARVIESNSTNDRLLNTGGNLDGHVFALAGRQLLFTRIPGEQEEKAPGTYNQLWVLLDIADPQAQPIRLRELDNILTAAWVPTQPYTFSYSTLLPIDQEPKYQALNDVNIARLDSRTAKLLKVTPVVKSRPTGVYGRWGTMFKWSPDGKTLAWAQADGAGIVDQKTGDYKKLFDYRLYSTTLSRNWIWMPTLSWSADGTVIATTVHGPPLGSEEAEFSPVFDIALGQAGGLFQVSLLSKAGMWAAPQYSPLFNTETGQGYLAYLKARTPVDSLTSEYDLVIADRDGSNARVIFPGKDRPGIRPINILYWNTDPEGLVWSPDGRQVAVIYEGEVWIADAASGSTRQVTLVGNTHHVRWTR
jgi:resuscitation-promoting factor RpfB